MPSESGLPVTAADSGVPPLGYAIAQLHGAGFSLAATLVRGGDDLFAASLPPRLVYVLGAEGGGMSDALAAACRRLRVRAR